MRRFTGVGAIVAIAALLVSGCSLIGPFARNEHGRVVADVTDGRGPVRAPTGLVASLGTDREHGLGLRPGDRVWRPRRALDPDGQGQVFQRRMPPCGAAGSWGHWDYDDQLTDFHYRLTRRDDGTVFDTQLAI